MAENKEKIKKSSGNLKKLKEAYEVIQKKYSLADFNFMNETFEIENIDVDETELFVKIIRKHMTEKIFYILRTLEMFLNAQNAPLFILHVMKSFGETDKKVIQDLYKRITKYEIEAFGLEAEYNEKKEAEFIKNFCEEWKLISGDLKLIHGAMKDGYNKDYKKSVKSYFG